MSDNYQIVYKKEKNALLLNSSYDNQNWKNLLRNYRKFNLHLTYSIPLPTDKSKYQDKVWVGIYSINFINELTQEFPIYYFPTNSMNSILYEF